MEYQDTFNPGGEPTPYIEHRIDKANAPRVGTIPYRMSPSRQVILKKELKSLLDSGIIEECDSPYASPVVLIPKSNGEFKLCAEYRKLNAVAKSDSYSFPRMDDLIHKTSETKYMSTIDLRAGYHQVKMYTPDMDKIAFVCSFGVYRFTRMPFGLKTPPATFQRLIDFFRNGLKQFKLQANREKCHFMCQKVKYLGHLITRSGIEVDLVKVLAIMDSLPAHHDAPTAGHYGEEQTYQQISKRYYLSGMRSFISDYVKKCPECSRYKAENQKSAGLLKTPAYSQQFENLVIDLFGPLPETPDGQKWIFIIEDTAIKWIELFALRDATAQECAITLLEEVILRYGLPRCLISDSGTQFVSSVMQQICNLLDIDQCLTPVYCSQVNPVERKNRDLKPKIAILVGNGRHTAWAEKLPVILFSMNSAKCSSTGYSAAFHQFGREMSTADDFKNDLRTVIHNDNFVAEITPYLRKFASLHQDIKDRVMKKQDQRKEYTDKNQDQRKEYADKKPDQCKEYADMKRRNAVSYAPGDREYLITPQKSNKANKKSAKFTPRCDGPYIVTIQRSLTSYEVADPNNPNVPLGRCHSPALRPCLSLIPTVNLYILCVEERWLEIGLVYLKQSLVA
ncbi:Retrovirus-related Pol polyprotein like [Argiope bruennichi]|uniref:RNA-directed DNA polymerase n=1 Tax=Argiope bruennichi TaxID=94029 RepID=A0A8T0FFD8_ARGBR|nr:Retrovirus-related Pol polyprotein like [Argiope bruennichi]